MSLMFISKWLRLNYGKLNGEDKVALKRIAEKSNLLKKQIHSGDGNKRTTIGSYERID